MKKIFPLEKAELKITFWLSWVLFFRMLSVFLVLPIFNILAQDLELANFFLIGLAFGIYGLTQGIMQLPFGFLSDIWGRKIIIIFALILFIIGSLIASFSSNIYWMIGGRFLQGLGAMASVIFALLADSTREQVRARASAFLGMSIGIAFGISFVFAPILAIWINIQQLFLLISCLGIAALLIIIFAIKETNRPKNKLIFLDAVTDCLKNKQLRILYFGSFFSGSGLAASLFITQIYLSNYLEFPKQNLWIIYLIMLLLSFVFMIPITFYSEKKNRFDRGILLGTGFLLSSFILSIWGITQLNFWFISAGLIVFFVGYSIFEPLFPSLISRLSPNKGTASGIFNLCQFIGHFTGAIISGALLTVNIYIVYSLLFTLGVLFLFALQGFQNPIPKSSN